MVDGTVTVVEIRDSFALSLAEAALEEEGIPYVIEADDAQYLPGIAGTSGIGATPLWKCLCRIQVPLDMATRARGLLEPLQHPYADGASE
jgi:hypothetical protein